MDKKICLSGKKIELKPCTKEFWHEFYSNYINDPMMDETPYIYDYERVEKAYRIKTSDVSRLYFSIICKGVVVGEIYLKHINKDEASAEIGIALKNDSVKGKGLGTEAINLLVGYSFNVLGIKRIAADTVLWNTRSQHVLEKIGFIYTHEDSVFKYYMLEANHTV